MGNSNERILVIGALGQVGRELLTALAKKHGHENVWASDVKEDPALPFQFVQLDVLNKDDLLQTVKSREITQVFNLAALLSATAEKHIEFAWKLSVNGLFNVLDLAREGHIKRVFWPSSIAVFGPNTPKENTPQHTIIEPDSVYGIAKQAGEQWCNYYHKKFGVDVRSIRYPGLIGYNSLPGGGTTDYAVDIFYKAIEDGHYTCYLEENTRLPMMYIEDAIRATTEIMEAPEEQIKVRSSYNLAGFSFSPKEIAAEIRKQLPEFTISYEPDYRQDIAASWPSGIDDSAARNDWKWKHRYELPDLVDIMLTNLKQKVTH